MYIRRASLAPGRGFSLVELVVALAITSIVLLAVAVVALQSTTSLATLCNHLELSEQNQQAAAQLANDLRACQAVTGYSTNGLVLQLPGGSTVTYSYSSNAKTLTRTQGGSAKVLLAGCQFIEFRIYQRNPIGGAYDIYPTADTATCKVVKANWSCSKILQGDRLNSGNMTTGYIVIRRP